MRTWRGAVLQGALHAGNFCWAWRGYIKKALCPLRPTSLHRVHVPIYEVQVEIRTIGRLVQGSYSN